MSRPLGASLTRVRLASLVVASATVMLSVPSTLAIAAVGGADLEIFVGKVAQERIFPECAQTPPKCTSDLIVEIRKVDPDAGLKPLVGDDLPLPMGLKSVVEENLAHNPSCDFAGLQQDLANLRRSSQPDIPHATLVSDIYSTCYAIPTPHIEAHTVLLWDRGVVVGWVSCNAVHAVRAACWLWLGLTPTQSLIPRQVGTMVDISGVRVDQLPLFLKHLDLVMSRLAHAVPNAGEDFVLPKAAGFSFEQ